MCRSIRRESADQSAPAVRLVVAVATGDDIPVSFSEVQLEQMRRLVEQTQSPKTGHELLLHSLPILIIPVNTLQRSSTGRQAMTTHATSRVLRPQGYDPAERTQRVDDLIAVFTRPFLQSLQPVNESQQPIVVVGMPRSGTSLVEQILSSHPRCCRRGRIVRSGQSLSNSNSEPLETRSKLTAIPTEWRIATADRYDDLLSRDFSQSRHVVDKLPSNYLNLGLIASAFPNATIIHCCRDPRDAACPATGNSLMTLQLQISTSRSVVAGSAVSGLFADHAALAPCDAWTNCRCFLRKPCAESGGAGATTVTGLPTVMVGRLPQLSSQSKQRSDGQCRSGTTTAVSVFPRPLDEV